MSKIKEVMKRNGSSIKVGTSGTISTLMSRELETMKQTPRTSSSSQRKYQSKPVSVPCDFLSKKTRQRKSSSNESHVNRNGSNNINSDHHSTRDADKPVRKTIKNGHGVPRLVSEDISRDNKVPNKGHAYSAEVVDVRCNDPVRRRLKKLGFSRLSKSFS